MSNDERQERMFSKLSKAISDLASAVREASSNNINNAIIAMAEEVKNMAIKVSEIKTAVAEFKKQNREALAEIGTKIADLNQQIADLIAGVGDPTVTDEVFEQDLRDLAADAKALADLVPGNPTPETPPV